MNDTATCESGHMRVDNVCGVCGAVDESENHLFFRCNLSHLFWFCSPLQLNSFDLVCRDFAGLLHGAGGSGSEMCHSAAAGEACAIRTALLACIDNGFDNVVIESDAKVIIQMLRNELPHDFSLECILGDIEVLVRRMMFVSFSFVPRESNLAAHSVAKFVFKEGREFGWDCIGLEFLFNTLVHDVNLSIRI
ncbi:hypothetical protein ACFX19_009899 [Malus domestica]